MSSPGYLDPIDTPERVLESGLPIGIYNYEGATTASFTKTPIEAYKKMWAG